MKEKRIWANILRYKFRSIFVKNIVINILFITIPLLLISWIVYLNSYQIVENEVSAISATSLSRNRDLFDALLKKADYVSATFSRMLSVREYLSSDPETLKDDKRAKDILTVLKPFVLADDYINSIYVYSEKKQTIITMEGIFPISSFSDTNWMESCRNSKDILPYRISRRLFGDFSPVISVIKPIRADGSKEWSGAVVINISLDRLNTSIIHQNLSDEILVIGDDDVILFSDNRENIGHLIDDILEADAYREMIHSGQHVKYLRSLSYMLLYEQSSRDSVSYLMKIPLNHFENQFREIRRMFIFLLFISFIISLAASVLLAINSYRPIDRLLDFVKNPDNTGQLKFRTEEIREIAASLLTTVNSNRHLKDELLRKLSLIDKSRIYALQAQINPHFLYNTLDAIRWSAMELTGNENDVSDMIASLARLLRLSLDTSNNMVTVREEIEHAEQFSSLLGKRYPGKFEVEWKIEETVRDCLMLKLCLQPLIENAYYHGIKPTRRKGIIRIEGFKEKNRIHFRIGDTGKGIPQDEIISLNNCIREDLDLNDMHIGLRNVNQRIKLLFGEEWGLTLSSNDGRGTTIDLFFPFIKES